MGRESSESHHSTTAKQGRPERGDARQASESVLSYSVGQQIGGGQLLRMGDAAMFESLDEEIKATEGGSLTGRELLMRYLGITILSLLLFAGLYLGIVALE